jgi:hypothetical protein
MTRNPKKPAAGEDRPSSETHWMEEIIQAAIRRGDFDDLPGKGQPLDLTSDEPDPYDKNGSWMVNRVMRYGGLLPEWIELDRQIRADLAWLRATPKEHPERRSRIVELNDRIVRFNLTCPSSSQHKPRYRE